MKENIKNKKNDLDLFVCRAEDVGFEHEIRHTSRNHRYLYYNGVDMNRQFNEINQLQSVENLLVSLK